MPAYLRKYELLIGSPAKTYAVYTPPPIIREREMNEGRQDPSSYVDYRTEPAGTDYVVAVRDLHFTAVIDYSSEKSSSPNQTAEIRIYNLSAESQQQLQKDCILFLKAGYETELPFVVEDQMVLEANREKEASSELPTIFNGQVETVWTEKEGQDIITTLVCKDLGYAAKNLRVSLSFGPGKNMASILGTLLQYAAQRGIPTGKFDASGYRGEIWEGSETSLFQPLSKGFVVEGNLIEQIQTLCAGFGLRAYIVLGALYIEPASRKPSVAEVVVLRPENIKGSVRRYDDGAGASLNSTENTSGIKAATFLNGNITTNKLVRLDTGGPYDGTYAVKSVRHTLEYEGSSWDTEVTATKIEN